MFLKQAMMDICTAVRQTSLETWWKVLWSRPTRKGQLADNKQPLDVVGRVKGQEFAIDARRRHPQPSTVPPTEANQSAGLSQGVTRSCTGTSYKKLLKEHNITFFSFGMDEKYTHRVLKS